MVLFLMVLVAGKQIIIACWQLIRLKSMRKALCRRGVLWHGRPVSMDEFCYLSKLRDRTPRSYALYRRVIVPESQ